MRGGHTLLELALVLGLAGLLAGIAAVAVIRTRDELAVRRARDASAAMTAQARSVAIATGSATLVVDLSAAVIRLDEAPAGAAPIDLAALGVTVSSEPASDSVRIEFDGMGLGRVASRTLSFTRGRARAGIAISSYGRVRRW